ncbi:hypothetical protein [Aquibacillus rhizosphaerae]|uniref:Spore coat protein n=1 Tax=Aquibacillus rhizosphaerae TaxID=3051431 RepID=A0ABT7L9K7_9BACI|nr:hypothetical protein [Aquibacillus sp. LR5S19]MDL4842537.1 hypothetical protein [Aquibacillus sp. LR5S19]
MYFYTGYPTHTQTYVNQYQYRPLYGWTPPSRSPSPYPEVNTQQLKKSAKAFQPLMKDANIIIESFATEETFAYKVMSAAQKSETAKIKEYIKELGVTRDVEIKYNPDGIRLRLVNHSDNIECCKLSVSLQWLN